MNEKREEHTDLDIFADEETLAKEIAALRIEIARIEKSSDESDWEDKLHEKITETPGAKLPENKPDSDVPESDLTKNENWDFSSEFESVDVYNDEEIQNIKADEPVEEKASVHMVEYDKNPRINPDIEENDDEIVQLPPESEELSIPELIEEKEIVQTPKQVTPPQVDRLTDSELEKKKLQPAPKKIVVRKKNDAAIIKELGIGAGQKAIREAREAKNDKTFVIQASKPDSQKIRKKLLKSLADLHFENINIAKVEIDFQSTRPYLFIGKSLTRRQAHMVMMIMRNLKIPASVKVERT